MAGMINDLQRAHKRWVDHNFPGQLSHQPLLGMGEEVGELMHAHLKHEQGIRGLEDEVFMEAKADALGDLFIYMMSYANAEGLNLELCIVDTWHKVEQRDWVKFPINGKDM